MNQKLGRRVNESPHRLRLKFYAEYFCRSIENSFQSNERRSQQEIKFVVQILAVIFLEHLMLLLTYRVLC